MEDTSFSTSKVQVVLRGFIRLLLRGLAQLLFRVRVRGLEHGFPVSAQAGEGGQRLLVIANHDSFLDGILLGLFLPIDNPVFVVHTDIIKRPLWRWALGVMVTYLAVDPGNPMAMKQVIRLLESGRPVVIFPEGRITLTGNLMKVYEGPAFVAAKTGATLLPVWLDGPARSRFSRWHKGPRKLFPRITLTVLPATTLPMPQASTAQESRRKAGEALRRLMQKMALARPGSGTLYGALCDVMEQYGRRRRVLEDIKQVKYTYQDLLKMALMLGRVIGRMTRSGEHVGLLLPNLAPTLGLLLGLTALRRVPAMLNYTAGVDGMQTACTTAGIRLLVTSRAFVEQAELADKIAALQGLEHIVYLEDLRARITLIDKLWLLCWGLRWPRWVERKAATEDPAVVLFTSGSEGKPKGVVLSHRAILANIAQIRAVIDVSTDDHILNALPIFHSFGLTGGALLPLLAGANLFLYPSPLHYRVIPELIYDRGCTALFGTSTFLGNYADFAHPYDFYRLRYVIAGAEKLAPAVREQWFEKFGIRILEGYGATETAPVIAVNTPMAYRSGTVGQFLPGLEHRLQAVPGIERGGLLHVRGPNVMSGYLKIDQPGVLQMPASELGAGWYETGDIADVDEDGFVHIVGRIKRFAKVAGEMVSLEAVEQLAQTAAPAAQHAASSQPDPSKGEALVLFTTDAGLDRAALQEAARSLGLPELAVPRKIVRVAELPLLGTGKTDYVTLKHMAETA
ncbi:MAG: bifunctional acyl-ACP--phospholipid O-acyltransferase/long-chain-fatty-acid--ACP ligase [Burkholderiaceae bacterium]|jgi:acyl-[acyl-carrier-protein]-phospholipid O-acyltransferase/long-chain-fatty-acid--[acyl-carrier-protein] ligase|nr:bifunctional acyl-ACP--phospholipid O-acyltransferase/long-chain-fatty-acid--ACP ligase [Burkholderiaceae bacterium]